MRAPSLVALTLVAGCAVEPVVEPGEGSAEQPGSSALVLVGTVVTMDETRPAEERVLGGGQVVVQGGKIVAVLPAGAPLPAEVAGARRVETGGLIFPGLINTHNHLAYNFLPPWEMPRVHDEPFANMYDWMEGSGDFAEAFASYDTNVVQPKNAAMAAGLPSAIGRWSELKELVGATTTTQGSRSFRRAEQGAEDNASFATTLVRNMDLERGARLRQSSIGIFLPRPTNAPPGTPHELNTDMLAGVVRAVEQHKVDAFMVHLAEGTDAATRHELHDLNDFERAADQECGPLAPVSVIIHGTPFGSDEFALMARCGMKLAASPLDNLLYYGTAPDLAVATAMGVPVAIGTDWSPAGSKNLLVELATVDFLNQALWGGALDDDAIVRMVTANAADMIGWGNRAGRIRVGLQADLAVIRGELAGPADEVYRALIEAREQDVQLVMVGGQPLWGDPALLEGLYGQAGGFDVVPSGCGFDKAVMLLSGAPDGQQHYVDLESTLREGLAAAAPGSPLSPLFQCADPGYFAAIERNGNVTFTHPEAAGLVEHLRDSFLPP